jgi:ABC-2 type transport system permease protein
MSGLLVKEFLYVRRQAKVLLLMVAFFAVFFLLLNPESRSVKSVTSALMSIMVMLTVILTINTFAYDELAKWDGYVLSLPIAKGRIVGAKYLFTVILSAAGALVTVLAGEAASGGHLKPEELVAACAGACASPLLLCSILLPMFYKFGLQKARVAFIAVFLIPMVAMPLIEKSGFSVSGAQWMLLLKLSPVILIAVVAASFLISCKIMEHKEV